MSAVLLSLLLAQAAAVPGVSERLRQAEQHALHDEAEAAIDVYEGILAEGGAEVAGLRYNLGTLYLERGDVGRAVLHLEKALKQDPSDDDARHNLEIALADRADQLQGVGPGIPWWLELGRRVPPWLAQLAFLLPFLLFVALLAAYGWVAPRRGARALLLVVGLVTLIGAGVLSARLFAEGERVAVVLEETAARKGPEASASISFTAHPGLSGTVQEAREGFSRLRLDNGVEAWLDDDALGLVE